MNTNKKTFLIREDVKWLRSNVYDDVLIPVIEREVGIYTRATVCFRDEDNQTTHGCNDIKLRNASYLAHKEAGFGEIIDIKYLFADTKKYGYAYVRKDLLPNV